MPAKRSFTLALALLLVAAIPARATSAPTITVIDVAPGAGDSYAMDTGAPGELNGYLYFQADDGTNGMELWRSNGTSTVLVEDICVGGNDSSPTDFTQLGTYLYFRADDCLSGRELWRTNGTTTERVLDINPGNSGQDSSTPRCFAEFNGYLYFQAEDGTSGRELWRTNGTITEMVENMYNGSGSSNPNWLTVSGSYLYFQAESVTDGVEIWRTNGITTTQVADINVGASSSSPQHLFSFDGFVYFQAEDLVTGAELWRTDGTTTTQLLDINTNGTDSSYPSEFTPLGGYLYFSAVDATHGTELWRTNGTVTEIVEDFNTTGSSYPGDLTLFDGGIFMSLSDDIHGVELCVLDAVDPATAIHCWDLNMGINSTGPDYLTVLGDALYFMGENALGDDVIWRIALDRTREVIAPPVGIVLDCDECDNEIDSAGSHLYMTVSGSLNGDPIGYELAYLTEPSVVLPETNRDGSAWSTVMVILAAITAIAGVGLNVRKGSLAS